MFRRVSVVFLPLLLLGSAGAATAADLAAGQAKVQQICSECHEVSDFKGKTEADLRSKIGDIVAGKMQHKKKLQLTDADIANVAAYLASGGSGGK